jgi:hypothetical protein
VNARPHRKESRSRRRVVLGVVLVFVFAVGIAFGEALNDNPGHGQTVTQEQLLTLQPESATVTVTTP